MITQELKKPITKERLAAITCASTILSGWISKNECNIEDLQKYISSLYEGILENIQDTSCFSNIVVRKEVAKTIKNSVQENYIVCLEDGIKLKTLKRHLMSKYKMTILDYKLKWNLPLDYPCVAPGYAKTRSSIAKKKGKANDTIK